MGVATQGIRIDSLLEELDRYAVLADDTGRTQQGSLDALKASGLLGSLVPLEYGGLGYDSLFAGRLIASIAEVDPSIAIIVFQHFSVVSRILEWGSLKQRTDYLPKLANGQWLAASAWSETGAGANKQNISTVADRTVDGDWVIGGVKSFTTGSGLADLYLVLVQTGTGDPGSLYGNSGQSFFLIETTQGITADADTNLSGMRGSSTGFINLHQCEVANEQLIGPLGGAPRVINGIRECGLTLGSVSLGISEAAYKLALAQVLNRGQQSNPVLQTALSELHMQLEAVRALVEKVAAKEGGDQLSQIAYQSKIFASESSEKIVREAQQIIGGSGYVRGKKIERLLRDARAVSLMGPVNRLAREIIGRELIS
ncbi:acyl-CoA dehydrogenase family protein [Paenibacillus radicis (ex Gao et al. 2016)]|uniref:Acyl-CoA dehydrogenase n=1 Tax=Paenibacillus radicis (ex Gao et al. 2016) TaxID=1737354 RepID=A0A917H286_9BACL|nr:acyl-CoA dehydrogenase family protein [Paenibacillus radicis (ex Gao et al. 2016)]GGG65581.1 acyl-CoA dehydrogenase [Paenibacillus radicis (ex Gao et al. 2016)]